MTDDKNITPMQLRELNEFTNEIYEELAKWPQLDAELEPFMQTLSETANRISFVTYERLEAMESEATMHMQRKCNLTERCKNNVGVVPQDPSLEKPEQEKIITGGYIAFADNWQEVLAVGATPAEAIKAIPQDFRNDGPFCKRCLTVTGLSA